MDEENGREEEKRRQVLTWALVRWVKVSLTSFSPPRALASRWGWRVDKSDIRTVFCSTKI